MTPLLRRIGLGALLVLAGVAVWQLLPCGLVTGKCTITITAPGAQPSTTFVVPFAEIDRYFESDIRFRSVSAAQVLGDAKASGFVRVTVSSGPSGLFSILQKKEDRIDRTPENELGLKPLLPSDFFFPDDAKIRVYVAEEKKYANIRVFTMIHCHAVEIDGYKNNCVLDKILDGGPAISVVFSAELLPQWRELTQKIERHLRELAVAWPNFPRK